MNEEKNVNPYDIASGWSRITYGWITRFLKKGYKKALEAEDLDDLPTEIQADTLNTRFEKYWKEYQNPPYPGLAKQVWKCFRKRFSIAAIPRFLGEMSHLAIPVVLSGLLRMIGEYYIQKAPQPISIFSESSIALTPFSWAIILSFCIFFLSICSTFCMRYHYQKIFIISLCIFSILNQKIYEKSLKLDMSSRQRFPPGKILHLLSGDCSRIKAALQYLHFFWSSALKIIICIALLLYVLGIPALVGVLVLFLFLPLQIWLMYLLRNARKQANNYTDKRFKLTHEILRDIRLIKLYGWEKSIKDVIHIVRQQELGIIRKILLLRAILFTTTLLQPFLGLVFTFLVYSNMNGSNLSADIIFPVISIFGMLRAPLSIYPMAVTVLADSKTSITRIEEFLKASEGYNISGIDKNQDDQGSVLIRFENASFCWSHGSLEDKSAFREFKLLDLNINITKGMFVVVIGGIGAGKTALLSAIHGDMHVFRKSIESDHRITNIVKGRIGFCQQHPFIFGATIRDNILFGREYIVDKYQNVIECCKLEQYPEDFYITELGRNIGMDQRYLIALARMLYEDADILLMDDPFVHMNASTKRNVFNNICLSRSERKSKTIILVTGDSEIISQADWILYINNGKIYEQGPPSHIKSRLILTDSSIQYHEESKANILQKSYETVTSPQAINYSPYQYWSRNRDSNSGLTSIESIADWITTSPELGLMEPITKIVSVSPLSIEYEHQKDEIATIRKKKLKLEEFRYKGPVSWHYYSDYLHAIGWLKFIIPAFLLYCVKQVFSSLYDFSLKDLSSTKDHISFSNPYFIKYTLFGLSQIIVISAICILFSWFAKYASLDLHDRALFHLLSSPLHFLESTPVGQMINRFGNDMITIDDKLLEQMRRFGMTLTFSIGSLVVLSLIIPFALIGAFALFIFYYGFQRFYRPSNRELSRLVSILRSPYYAHVSESIIGLSAIASFQRTSQFLEKGKLLLNRSLAPIFYEASGENWFIVRLEGLGAIISWFVTIICAVSRLPESTAALVIHCTMNLNEMMFAAIKIFIEIESDMDAVQRIFHYINDLESEENMIIDSNKSLSIYQFDEYPAIEYKNVTIHYPGNTMPALCDISFNIKAREKICIVGRSGSGKTTLILSLFYLLKLDHSVSNSSIMIHGKDIQTIPLNLLRRSIMTIVEQEATLFSGSIRYNLDPWNEHTDKEIWDAVEQCKLRSFISSLQNQLYFHIAEKGENISFGQRQLLCLCRAILRHTEMLLIDDMGLYKPSQKYDLLYSKEEFSLSRLWDQTIGNPILLDTTVIVITNDYKDIINFDRVMVMDKGRIIEFDSPQILLSDPKSSLSILVDESGYTTHECLYRHYSASISQHILNKP